MKLLFHVQHMLGVGHRVRAQRIAHACAMAGIDVTLMEGGVPGQISQDMTDTGIKHILLPPAKAADAAFSGIVDAETGLPIDDAWRARRRESSLQALQAVAPDLVLIEGFPFARRAFRFELEPLAEAARARGARIAVSLRDILVARKDPDKDAQIADMARRLFDLILVHGDPQFASLSDSFSAASVLEDRLHYTGIVAPPAPHGKTHSIGSGEVLVSAGGGATGGRLMRAALAARPLSGLSNRLWRFLIGPNLPQSDRDALFRLQARNRNGVIIEPVRADFQDLLAGAALTISQAGYNTVADILVTGCPAVLVPFEGPDGRETEQPIRAGLLERSGRITMVREPDLTAERLAAAVRRAGDLPPWRTDQPIQTNGAQRTAEILKHGMQKDL